MEYDWHTWLPRGLNGPHNIPQERMFRNHSAQCITDSISVAMTFSDGVGHWLQYIATMSDPATVYQKILNRMFRTPHVINTMMQNIATLDPALPEKLLAHAELIKETLLQFLTLLSERIRASLQPLVAHGISDDERIGVALRECISIPPELRFRECLPALINGVIHTLAIMILREPTIPPMCVVSYDQHMADAIPTYALLVSLMQEQLQPISNTNRTTKVVLKKNGRRYGPRTLTLKRNLPRRSTPAN